MSQLEIPRQGPDRAPTVAIVGDPNVGKSSLFNRLVGRNRALVSRDPGTTRDLLTGYRRATGGSLRFLDTPSDLEEPVAAVVSGVDLVLLVTDAVRGCTPGDQQWAVRLRKAGIPVILVANKAESRDAIGSLPEFHKLASGDPMAVSAAHGSGIPRLLETIRRRLRERPEPTRGSPGWLVIGLVGRPNV